MPGGPTAQLGVVRRVAAGRGRARPDPTRAAARSAGSETRRWWLTVPIAALSPCVIGRLVTLPFALRISGRAVGGRADRAGAGRLVGGPRHEPAGLLGRWSRWCCWSWWGWRAGRRAGGSPGPAAVLVALVFAGSYLYPGRSGAAVQPVRAAGRTESSGAAVLALAEAEGVEVGEVLVSDASRRTTTLNAYVSGLGETRRVVLYDNLVEQPEEQVLAVVAHELAHVRHDDVLVGPRWVPSAGCWASRSAPCCWTQLRLRRRTGIRWGRGSAGGAGDAGAVRAGGAGREPGRERDQPDDRGRVRTEPRSRPARIRRRSSRCSGSWRCGRCRTRSTEVEPSLVRQPPDSAGTHCPGPRGGGAAVSRTLFVTNDFPPRRGGIETFVKQLCDDLPPERGRRAHLVDAGRRGVRR